MNALVAKTRGKHFTVTLSRSGQAAAQYRLQTRRGALALGASGVLLIGLVVIWLAL